MEVTLVNRDNFFLFTPMLHEVAASDLDISEYRESCAQAAASRHVLPRRHRIHRPGQSAGRCLTRSRAPLAGR